MVPFRLTGGEAEAREYYAGAWLDFYVATNKPEWQRMQQRILADKNTAFYFVFRSAIAAGCISSRQIWHDTRCVNTGQRIGRRGVSGGRAAHAAVFPTPPNPLRTVAARAKGYTHDSVAPRR